LSKIILKKVIKGVDKPVKLVYYGGMKHDSARKLERNKLVYQYWLEHRELSLKEIGELFGVSGTRIHYIVKKQRERESLLIDQG